MYRHLSFILIGDSGQRDAEIYTQIARKYPNRVEAIYIRDVTNNSEHKRMLTLVAEAAKVGVQMILVPTTKEAALHAASAGYITNSELEELNAHF